MKHKAGFLLALMMLAFLQLNAQYVSDSRSGLKHSEKTFGNKMLRGTGYALGYNAVIMTALVLSPEYISQWDRKEVFTATAMREQYIRTFTTAPVKDNDLAVINYIGHPYQGSFYFNATRSQGALFWQASLFTILQSALWEYVWEGGLEQPSIQDLIITPLGGILLGELSHRATLAMRKNGFQWYEIIATCIINPAFAINNGFKRPAFCGN
ncbi:MAG TPA: DUF3943 domain-containing protein [Bacteroidales bacterium]|nr:DUF3943 domain-containing protein [Bacteroidales bacterium]HPJ55334.1 DUF3943 domain-containing protein [Bacteroidales bacterium]HPQ56417.1 DUF3943 domain-containing protein [Bacteroidales bacterium]